MLPPWQARLPTTQRCIASRSGTWREIVRGMRNAAVLAITLLAACGRTPEPQQGAFEPDDAVQTTSSEARIAVDRRAVPLEKMLMGRWLAGVPMRGMANVKIDLAAPVKNDLYVG